MLMFFYRRIFRKKFNGIDIDIEGEKFWYDIVEKYKVEKLSFM